MEKPIPGGRILLTPHRFEGCWILLWATADDQTRTTLLMQRLLKIFISHPLPAWLSLSVLVYIGYYGGRWVSNIPLHLALTGLSGLLYIISILFSTFFIYLASYLQGLTPRTCLLSAAVIPFLWMTKDVLALSAAHPFFECLYFYFNPMYIFYVCIMSIEIGLAALLGRWWKRRTGCEMQVYYPAPVIVIGTAMLVMIAIYSWGQGENLNAFYLEGYRLLFGGG